MTSKPMGKHAPSSIINRSTLASVIAHGLRALSTVLVPVFVGRYLPVNEFGIYALFTSFFLLVSFFVTSFVAEPLLIFSNTKYRASIRPYLSLVAGIGAWLTISCALAFAVAGFAFTQFELNILAQVAFGYVFVAPTFLLLLVLDRLAYGLHAASLPVVANASALTVTGFLLAALLHIDSMSLLSVLLCVGVGQTVGVLYIWRQLRLRVTCMDGGLPVTLADVLRQHFQYGRWALPAQLMVWAIMNMFLISLPFLRGSIDEVAELKALLLLINPVLLVVGAMSVALIPRYAKVFRSDDLRRLRYRLYIFILFSGALVVVGFGLAGGSVIRLVFAGRFSLSAESLWLAGFVPIAGSLLTVGGMFAKLLNSVQLHTYALGLACSITLPIGIAVTFAWGVVGAIIAQTACFIFAAIALEFLLMYRSPQLPTMVKDR